MGQEASLSLVPETVNWCRMTGGISSLHLERKQAVDLHAGKLCQALHQPLSFFPVVVRQDNLADITADQRYNQVRDHLVQ